MGHNVHPKAFRIKETADWDSRGFYKKNFPEYLREDFRIRKFLGKKLKDMGIEKIEIERSQNKVNIIISSARPGLIIGRGGEGVEAMKKELTKFILDLKPVGPFFKAIPKKEIRIEVREVRDVWSSAPLVAQWIAQQIEKRLPHRRVMKSAIEKVVVQKGIKGVRVEMAGRLDGAQISRREWLRKGRLPRQTLRSIIDYAPAEAQCTYGIIGIKVWLYKGEKFD